MIRLLLDQGLPRSAVPLLNESGCDVEHVGTIGMASAADHEILQHARQTKRVVCTLDADFHALLALSGDGAPSVIRIRRQGMTGALLAQLLLAVFPRIAPALTRGVVISITDQALRFRYLPLRRA